MLSSDSDFLQKLLPEIQTLSEEAGCRIMEVYGYANMEVSYKEDDSPLTLADSRSHQLIAERLNQLTPHIPVLSEEAEMIPFSQRNSWDLFWLVDPLDGTKEFVSRNGEFSVNIALIKKNTPVLGVMHAPALKMTYFACRGGNAFKKDVSGKTFRIQVSDYRQGLVVAASRSHDRDKMDAILAKWNPVKVMNVGSALKMGLVAEGTAQLYPRLGPTMEWDTAAAHCILNEAGGSLCLWDGKPLLYNKPDLTNPGFICLGNPPFPWNK